MWHILELMSILGSCNIVKVMYGQSVIISSTGLSTVGTVEMLFSWVRFVIVGSFL